MTVSGSLRYLDTFIHLQSARQRKRTWTERSSNRGKRVHLEECCKSKRTEEVDEGVEVERIRDSLEGAVRKAGLISGSAEETIEGNLSNLENGSHEEGSSV